MRDSGFAPFSFMRKFNNILLNKRIFHFLKIKYAIMKMRNPIWKRKRVGGKI